MIFKICLFGKTFWTLTTTKWPCTLMNMYMTTKISWCCKCLITIRTFMRFFLNIILNFKNKPKKSTDFCMCHSMIIKIRTCRKTFTTYFTWMWLQKFRKLNLKKILSSLTFSPLCIRQWVFKEDDVENAFPHVGHTCGFSPEKKMSLFVFLSSRIIIIYQPVCVRVCRLKSEGRSNIFPHTSHVQDLRLRRLLSDDCALT